MVVPIFLSSDNNYAPFVATTMASICSNTKSYIEFYILDGGISEENQLKIKSLNERFNNFGIEVIKIDKEKSFKDFKTSVHISKAAYFRFLIPNLLPNRNKIIYLDVDIIAKGDILSLFEIDLNNYTIGAVPDSGDERYLSVLKNSINMKQNSHYFNSGVLLINSKLWKKNRITERLFDIENKYRETLISFDQDILNKCFENNFKILDLKFNTYSDNKSTVILHYYHRIKPWQADFSFNLVDNKPFKISGTNHFWHYAEMTPFFNEILKRKENFLNSSILYKRLNKMVAEGKIK